MRIKARMFSLPQLRPRNCAGCDVWTVYGSTWSTQAPTCPLHCIAQAVGRSVPHLVATNPGVDWAALQLGQTVWIGDADVWMPGDDLIGFCSRHHVGAQDVCEANAHLTFDDKGPEPWTVVRIPRVAVTWQRGG